MSLFMCMLSSASQYHMYMFIFMLCSASQYHMYMFMCMLSTASQYHMYMFMCMLSTASQYHMSMFMLTTASHYHIYTFQVLDDWKYIARVIDRLLLYIFLMVTIGGTIGLLMQAPHILEYVDQDQIIQDIIRKWNLEAT